MGEIMIKNLKGIVIDAGHGGNDSGAVGNGIIEKDLTLKIATYIANRLKEDRRERAFFRVVFILAPVFVNLDSVEIFCKFPREILTKTVVDVILRRAVLRISLLNLLSTILAVTVLSFESVL